MFNKVLVANRGEIACRIIKTCKKLNIHSVAIYSTADQASPHVTLADSAFWVGEASAAASYLNIQAIIAAAIASQAEAIHPGYGFLAENPLFAKACADVGIIFIGPSVEAMEIMASKQLAKQLLQTSSVPLIPGYHGAEQSVTHLLDQAKNIGFPILLKAANGGGGKGMRTVYAESEFAASLSGAQREAKICFADQQMIIEKLIANPRHVEVQIIADNHGNILHLFDRDCSIQRRHQKIIEEAPAPNLSSNLRNNLTQAACQVAATIHYRGAGTVEFLVAQDEKFYFIEMNTRLQVEHPVTEMVTGLDLVELQLKIAANEVLTIKQQDIKINGHAVECRIYAEDPAHDFLPASGMAAILQEPKQDGIRIDSFGAQSFFISRYYDALLSKLIAWGQTREQALKRLIRGLENYIIGGVKTNIPFLSAICKHERFVNGNLGTDFLTKERIVLPTVDLDSVLCFIAGFDYLQLRKSKQDFLSGDCFAWQMVLPSYWLWDYVVEKRQISVQILPITDNVFQMEYQGKKKQFRVFWHNKQLAVDDGTQIRLALVSQQGQTIYVYFHTNTMAVERFAFASSIHKPSSKGELTAPMPATIVAVLKQAGDKVKEGESLVILEAMKMEHTIHAPADGILDKIFYPVGAQVNEGAQLLALKTD